jgi:hypothetical protein
MEPTTHAAIHNHSRPTSHPTWVWISSTSTVDEHGRLGFPATEAESHRLGARARKVFLRQPLSNLHESLAQAAVMGWDGAQPSRLWKRRGDEDRGDGCDQFQEEGEARAKRQVGMGAHVQGSGFRGPGSDYHGGGVLNREGWQGRRPPESRGHQWQGSDQRRFDQGGKSQFPANPKPLELLERLTLAKEKKGMMEKKEEDPRKIKCFQCQELGHHQKDCTNIPICYKCKEEGHMVAECSDFHSKSGELKMFGFAIPEQGFYSFKIPGEGDNQRASCIIQVLQGEASEKKIEEELKNLINSQWDWKVKQVQDKEYVDVFPDKSSLHTFSKISEILMSLHGIKVKIFKASIDPDAQEMLQTSWVKIYGLPSVACKEEVVRKVATLAGEPLVVDELSLVQTGPVRVKMNCRDPAKLRGFVRIFFNLVGYDIRFVSGLYKDKINLPPPPPTAKDDGCDEEEEDGDDSDDSDRKHKRKSEKYSRREPAIVDRSGGSGGNLPKGQSSVGSFGAEGVQAESNAGQGEPSKNKEAEVVSKVKALITTESDDSPGRLLQGVREPKHEQGEGVCRVSKDKIGTQGWDASSITKGIREATNPIVQCQNADGSGKLLKVGVLNEQLIDEGVLRETKAREEGSFYHAENQDVQGDGAQCLVTSVRKGDRDMSAVQCGNADSTTSSSVCEYPEKVMEQGFHFLEANVELTGGGDER